MGVIDHDNNRRASELILNSDGSVYHLALLPGQVANTIITVGDPARVELISRHFDIIDHNVQKREFVTHTGRIGSKQLSVVSTGIGGGNIDIVINEIDALFNIDLRNGMPKPEHKSVDFVRIGTSGSVQENIREDKLLVSKYALGLDGLGHFYKMSANSEVDMLEAKHRREVIAIEKAFRKYDKQHSLKLPVKPYFSMASKALIGRYGDGLIKGITVTCPGFYAPQGRQLRLPISTAGMIELLSGFKHKSIQVTNLEMETATLYALAQRLGHRAVSLNAILANRVTGNFSEFPQAVVEKLILRTLNRV